MTARGPFTADRGRPTGTAGRHLTNPPRRLTAVRGRLGLTTARDRLGLTGAQGRHLTSAGGRRTAVRRLLALLALPVVLTGCGIRATEVPTDFGPAPSRVRCSLSEPDVMTQAGRGVPVQVFLLCGSSLVAVDRVVSVPEGASDAARRGVIAQGLLDQLARVPTAAEKEAGYTTDVRDGMTVGGPRQGDPDDALRLSAAPDSLTSYALAQVVCTFSDSAAADGDGAVVLGGPDDKPLRRYECTDEVRSRPGSKEPPSKEVAGN